MVVKKTGVMCVVVLLVSVMIVNIGAVNSLDIGEEPDEYEKSDRCITLKYNYDYIFEERPLSNIRVGVKGESNMVDVRLFLNLIRPDGRTLDFMRGERVKVSENLLFSERGESVFSFDWEEYEPYLNIGSVDPTLKDMFESNGVQLSGEATIPSSLRDGFIQIIDGKNRYIIEDTGGDEGNVYHLIPEDYIDFGMPGDFFDAKQGLYDLFEDNGIEFKGTRIRQYYDEGWWAEDDVGYMLSLTNSGLNVYRLEDFMTRFNMRSDIARDAIYGFGSDIHSEHSEDPPPPSREVQLESVPFSKANENILTDPEPLNGEYTLTIRAYYGTDIDLDSTYVIFQGMEPSEPRNLKARYHDGSVKLEWDEPEDIGGSDLVQYNVFRASTSDSYKYIGNVSADNTEFIDDLTKEDRLGRSVSTGDVLFYRVVAINSCSNSYLWGRGNWESVIRPETSPSAEQVVHIPHHDAIPSDMSYKWVVNYSRFDDSYFSERGGLDTMAINQMDGGEVFFYDVEHIGEDDGLQQYEYVGGFYSQGEFDIEAEMIDSVSSSLEANVEHSWVDFSGEIWAEEVSTGGHSGLTVVKQTIESEGSITASTDSSFIFEKNLDHSSFEVSREINIHWELNLEIDYIKDNIWIPEDNILRSGEDHYLKFSVSGDLKADVAIEIEDNLGYQDKNIVDKIEESLSGEFDISHVDIICAGYRRVFSPFEGACRIGYLLALEKSVGLDEDVPTAYDYAFIGNCQSFGFSSEGLYEYRYLDPMVLPGIGSFLGSGLKRTEFFGYFDEEMENRLENMLRAYSMSLSPDLSSEEYQAKMEAAREGFMEDIWKNSTARDPWTLDQAGCLFIYDYIWSGWLVEGRGHEPIGYFVSETFTSDDINSYHDDKQAFFEKQMAREYGEDLELDDDDEESTGFGMLMWALPLVAIVVIVLAVFMMKKKGSADTESIDAEDDLEEEEMSEDDDLFT